MKKTISVTLDKIQHGDIVKIQRVFRNGAVQTTEGRADRYGEAWAIAINQTKFVNINPMNMSDGLRQREGIVAHQVLSITREIEVPDLPMEMGSLIWTRSADSRKTVRRTLVMYTVSGEPKRVWYGKYGYIEPGDVMEWQPVTPDTLETPAEDGWIER